MKSAASLIFNRRVFRRRWRFGLNGDGNALAGHCVVFIYPAAEIDQFATLRAKRTMRVILPLDRFATGGTFHGNDRPRFAQRFRLQTANRAGRFTRIFLLTKSIVPSRRMAFKRTVTLSRVEPTIEAISRWGRGISINTPPSLATP